MRHSRRFWEGLRCSNSGRSRHAICTTEFGQLLTFIGKIEKGFDFLCYHVSSDGLSVAQPTVERFIEKIIPAL
jgi:hypothetical protein